MINKDPLEMGFDALPESRLLQKYSKYSDILEFFCTFKVFKFFEREQG